ncbi:MAG TPA: hypothetical protein VNO34_10990 [Actinomycetota bacterium]|nr:hypothetical protein [Actinomycetota bacterium]
MSVSPLAVFAVGFLLLLGSVVAVGAGHFGASELGPWVSLGLSAGAVGCTVVALLMRPRR